MESDNTVLVNDHHGWHSSQTGKFYLLSVEICYIVIRIWRRNDPARARDYKRQSLALAMPLLQALGQGE